MEFHGIQPSHFNYNINIILILKKKNIKDIFGGKRRGSTILVFRCGTARGKRHFPLKKKIGYFCKYLKI